MNILARANAKKKAKGLTVSNFALLLVVFSNDIMAVVAAALFGNQSAASSQALL